MNNYYSYIRARAIEIPIWSSIPFIGMIFTDGHPPLSSMILFFVTITMGSAHLILINDWGGLVKSPKELNRYDGIKNAALFSKVLLNAAIVTLIIGVVAGIYLFPLNFLIGLGVAGVLLSFLYSHPTLHLKESPVASKFLHLMGGTLLFSTGVIAFSGDIGGGILFGLFFGMMSVAGHSYHEAIDHNEDMGNGVKTSATIWSSHSVARLGFLIFIVSHLYLILLAIFNLVSWQVVVIFSLPVLCHVYRAASFLKGERLSISALMTHRNQYRIAYAISIVVFVLYRIATNN